MSLYKTDYRLADAIDMQMVGSCGSPSYAKIIENYIKRN